MRCKACNTILRDHELYINKKSGEVNDLCFPCLGRAKSSDELEIYDADAAEEAKTLDELGVEWDFNELHPDK